MLHLQSASVVFGLLCDKQVFWLHFHSYHCEHDLNIFSICSFIVSISVSLLFICSIFCLLAHSLKSLGFAAGLVTNAGVFSLIMMIFFDSVAFKLEDFLLLFSLFFLPFLPFCITSTSLTEFRSRGCWKENHVLLQIHHPCHHDIFFFLSLLILLLSLFQLVFLFLLFLFEVKSIVVVPFKFILQCFGIITFKSQFFR